MDKKQLRILARRLLDQEDSESDPMIAVRVKMMLAEMTGPLFLYVSVGKEIGTHDLIEYFLEQGKTVCVPKIVARGVMEAVEIRHLSDLHPGILGIPEPGNGKVFEPERIQACLIPCLMCSPDGSRLGQGGGYYDRFLKRSSALRIGLCREHRLGSVPMEQHDQYLDYVITERQIYRREAYGLSGTGKKLQGNHVSGPSEK